MKTAYRVVTPILAAASVVMGFLLKMFSFKITVLNYEQLGGTYSFSIVEAIKRLMSAATAEKTEDTAKKDIWELVKPMITPSAVFIVFLVITMLIFISIIFVSALSNNRKPIFALCAAGLVCMLVCIVSSNAAFDTLMNSEEISLSDIITSFSTNTLITLAAYFVTIASAGLSAGFYAMFGIFLLIIIWAIFVGYAIKSPIHVSKREYKRSKPMRRIVKPSADKKAASIDE